MGIETVIESRRTIHTYKPESIPEKDILDALRAATFAPNHKLTYPWSFVLVGAETRKSIANLAVSLKHPEGEISEEKRAQVQSKFMDPAHLVVFCCQKNEDAFRAREDYATMACAIQNFSLLLWERKIGTKWSTGGPSRHEQTYEILGIDPREKEIVGFLWAGIPAHIPESPKRPSAESVLKKLP